MNTITKKISLGIFIALTGAQCWSAAEGQELTPEEKAVVDEGLMRIAKTVLMNKENAIDEIEAEHRRRGLQGLNEDEKKMVTAGHSHNVNGRQYIFPPHGEQMDRLREFFVEATSGMSQDQIARIDTELRRQVRLYNLDQP